MVNHKVPWSKIMVPFNNTWSECELTWNFMVDHGISWLTMVNHGFKPYFVSVGDSIGRMNMRFIKTKTTVELDRIFVE